MSQLEQQQQITYVCTTMYVQDRQIYIKFTSVGIAHARPITGFIIWLEIWNQSRQIKFLMPYYYDGVTNYSCNWHYWGRKLAHTVALYLSGVVAITVPIQFHLQTTPTADPPVFTLTCVSTGGPATTVTWTRNGAAATGVTSQIVVNMTSITYNSTLTVTGREPGNYTCSVANVRTAPPATASLTVAGEWDYTIPGPILIVCYMCQWCEGGS